MGNLTNQRLDQPPDLADCRCDVDWIRVAALGFLVIYHSAVAFQPWGTHLLLIWNERSLRGVWRLMEIVDIWRIPIVFVVSGMGLRLAVERKNWKQLLGDGALRILVPLVFGTFAVGPLSLAIAVDYYYGAASYVPAPGHLWFLANILIYVLLLLPFVIWVKRCSDNWLVRGFERLVGAGCGVGMALLAVPTILEAILVDPKGYASYAFTLHGLVLGFICFALGFLLVSTGKAGRRSAERGRFAALAIASGLCLARQFELWPGLNALLALESMSWMIAVWGFASRHLDKPSKTLRYLSSAVFPVYILHLPVQAFVSSFLMPLGIHPLPKFFLLVALTISGSLGLYEIVKRIRWVRLLFGMKWTRRKSLARQREAV